MYRVKIVSYTRPSILDSLTNCGDWLEEISDIECKGWSPMKLATALKILCIPKDDIPHNDPDLDFSDDELLKLKTHGPDYDGILRHFGSELPWPSTWRW